MLWSWCIIGTALGGAIANVHCAHATDDQERVVQITCDLDGDGHTDETTLIAYAASPDGRTATATTVHSGGPAGPVLRSVLATWSPSGQLADAEVRPSPTDEHSGRRGCRQG